MPFAGWLFLMVFVLTPVSYYSCLLINWTILYVKDEKWQASKTIRDLRYYLCWEWLISGILDVLNRTENNLLDLTGNNYYDNILKEGIDYYIGIPFIANVIMFIFFICVTLVSLIILIEFGLFWLLAILGLILCAAIYYLVIRLIRFFYRMQKKLNKKGKEVAF
jgi:hypothetical protein